MATAIHSARSAPDPHFAILGGGITGLTAAWEAVKRGEKHITVYEADSRLGGRILTGYIGNSVINMGAEFIDSEEKHLLQLAQEMGVGLSENTCRAKEEFQRPDGSIMPVDRFYASYRPYAEQVIRDREELAKNPNGERAQFLESLTLEQYAQHLAQSVALPSRSLWRFLKDTLSFRGDESKLALEMATKSFASECGQPISNLSATQFMAETSATPDSYLACDEHWRVEGGTEQIITKLKEKLAAHGVKFVTGAKVTSAVKGAHGADIGFENPALNTHAKQAFLALSSYALKDIKGLETFGLTPEMQHTLADIQYTNSFKFSVALKPGVKLEGGAFYSPNGFQVWSPSPGIVTLLSQADALASKPAKQIIMERLESYAKAHGSTAEKLFDFSQVNFANPGKKACYASPKPGQVKAIEAVQSKFAEMAKNGLGIAGTYLPIEGCIGFMECGVSSAKDAVAMLLGKEQSHTPQKQWTQHVEQQRAAAANDALFTQQVNAR